MVVSAKRFTDTENGDVFRLLDSAAHFRSEMLWAWIPGKEVDMSSWGDILIIAAMLGLVIFLRRKGILPS